MASILLKIGRISHSQFKSNCLTIEKHFLNFLFSFWDLHNILNILKKKMVFIANVFPKLQTVKNFVISFCKKRRFGTRFDSQHVKASQRLANSPWECFYHVFSSFWWKLIWKMSTLLLREILGVFVNTLTVDGKYPVPDCEKLQLSIQTQLCGRRKPVSQFLFHFRNLHQILNISTKEMIIIANVFWKLQAVKISVGPLCKRRYFRKRFESQHVKASEILAKALR